MEHFSEEELLKLSDCVEGRASWLERHYYQNGGKIEADKIRELGKKLMRFLENARVG